MTVSELYKSVAQLGFENSLEYEDGFVYAANRAILEVNALRPQSSYCVINHRIIANELAKPSFDPIEKTDELIFEASDIKSYYFECDGNGTAYIELWNDSSCSWSMIDMRSLSSNGEFKPYKGFIKNGGAFVSGRVRLRFVGNYLYSVKCVAFYRYIFSKEEADIPAFESFVRYDISKIVSDFMSLKTPPIEVDDKYRFLNQEYQVEDGRVILMPRDYPGVYKVLYNRLPRVLEDNGALSEDLTVIDLSEELCALLPILVASYIWMDDEPEKAQYYLSLYQSRASFIFSTTKNDMPVRIRHSRGW